MKTCRDCAKSLTNVGSHRILHKIPDNLYKLQIVWQCGKCRCEKTLRTSIPGFEVPVSRCEKIPGTTPLRSLTRYEHIIDLIAEYPILRQRYKAFKRGVQEAVEKGLEQGSDLSLVEHYELGRIFCY